MSETENGRPQKVKAKGNLRKACGSVIDTRRANRAGDSGVELIKS